MIEYWKIKIQLPVSAHFSHRSQDSITIIGQMAKRIKEELLASQTKPLDPAAIAKLIERSEKILGAVKKIEDLHAQHKLEISTKK